MQQIVPVIIGIGKFFDLTRLYKGGHFVPSSPYDQPKAGTNEASFPTAHHIRGDDVSRGDAVSFEVVIKVGRYDPHEIVIHSTIVLLRLGPGRSARLRDPAIADAASSPFREAGRSPSPLSYPRRR